MACSVCTAEASGSMFGGAFVQRYAKDERLVPIPRLSQAQGTRRMEVTKRLRISRQIHKTEALPLAPDATAAILEDGMACRTLSSHSHFLPPLFPLIFPCGGAWQEERGGPNPTSLAPEPVDKEGGKVGEGEVV